MKNTSSILLFNPNWRELEKIGRMSKMDSGLPLELLYIAGQLKKLNIKFKILDLWLLNKRIEDYSKEISKAEIIVINTAPSYLYWRDGTIDCTLPRKTILKIKKINPKIKTIVIGPHGTVLPESLISRKADYIVRGEPDIVVAKLIKNILARKDKDMPGVGKWKGQAFHISKDYAFVKNLNSLETPYEDFNLEIYQLPKYPKQTSKKITTSYYEASRGCPFNCIFCFREGFRGKLRLKSINKIDKELKKLKEIGIEYIYFIDECLGFDNLWFKKLLKILKKYKFEWGCQTRPHLWNKERIIEASESGCISMELGIESINKQVSRALNKEMVDLNKLRENIKTMISARITPGLSFIVGSPFETKKTIKESIDFVLEFPSDKIMIGCHIMLPYPKTKLWNIGLKDGLPLKSWPDVKRYAGIIHNDFKNPEQVNLEAKRFLSYIRIKKIKNQMNENLSNLEIMRLMMNLATLFGSYIIISFPKTSSFLEKTLNLFRNKTFVTDDYL